MAIKVWGEISVQVRSSSSVEKLRAAEHIRKKVTEEIEKCVEALESEPVEDLEISVTVTRSGAQVD